MTPTSGHGTTPSYREGERCEVCGNWYWERDGVGWHSLVPTTYADHQGEARMVICPTCFAKRTS